MATRILHGSTAATTVFTATLTTFYSQVEVINRGGDDLFVSMDGTTNPTVGGADFFVVPQNQTVQLSNMATKQWEQGADYDIFVTTSTNTGSGVVVPVNQITTSIPIGAVFSFSGGGTLTLTQNANNGDTTLTGNVATAAINGVGDLSAPTTTTVLLISTAVCKFSIVGIVD